MRNLLLTGLLLLLVLQVNAQRNFQPGYIIKHNDTISGYINLRTHKANSFSCEFKTELNGDLQKFRASEISGYGTKAGQHYRSFELNETSAAVPKEKKHPKAYFLNVLVAGKANLFFTRDISSKSRFFIQKDTVFKELETTQIRVKNNSDGKIYRGESKTYVGTLTYILADCKELKPLIDKTKLSPGSLLNTVRTYNQCLHPDSLYFVQKPKKSVTTFGLTGGPVFTSIKFREPYMYELPLTSESISNAGYSFGLTLNHTLPFLNEKLSFQTELLLVYNQFKINYQGSQFRQNASPTSNFVLYNLNGTINRYALKVPVLVRYSFNFQKFQPFVNVGLMVTKVVKTTDNGRLVVRTDQERREYFYPGYYPRPLYGNLVAGVGLVYGLGKKSAVFGEIKLVPEGIRSFYSRSSDISSIMINTGFRF